MTLEGTPTRAPMPGERCSCGRSATVVYQTENYGDVAWCGLELGEIAEEYRDAERAERLGRRR